MAVRERTSRWVGYKRLDVWMDGGWSMSIVLAMGDDARSTAAWPKLTRL